MLYSTCDMSADGVTKRFSGLEPRMKQPSTDVPSDFPKRIRSVRRGLQLTQTQLAERVGVSFATVNRWENRQSKPTRLAWQQILQLEEGIHAEDGSAQSESARPP